MIIEAILASIAVGGAWVGLWSVARLRTRPKYRQPVAGENTANAPRYGTRRWARAMYFNHVISLEELAAFYVDHPD